MSKRSLNHHEDTEESFFVSMTDIMVGLLFIFIILVVYFVLQVRIEAVKVRELEEQAGEVAQRTQLDAYRNQVANQREEILRGLQSFFEDAGFTNVVIDTANGVLRFPDGVLFESGEYEFSDGSKSALAVDTLADALAEVLPCSVLNESGQRFRTKDECRTGFTDFPNAYNAFVEAVYIEGHTDIIPVSPRGLRGDPKLNTNLKLSARRAANTFERASNLRPVITEFFGLTSIGDNTGSSDNIAVEPALAVSGYGEQRPISSNADPDGRRNNRRIDVRIVMYQPINFSDLETLREQLSRATLNEGNDELG